LRSWTFHLKIYRSLNNSWPNLPIYIKTTLHWSLINRFVLRASYKWSADNLRVVEDSISGIAKSPDLKQPKRSLYIYLFDGIGRFLVSLIRPPWGGAKNEYNRKTALSSWIKIVDNSLKFASKFSKRIQLKKARCANRASTFFSGLFSTEKTNINKNSAKQTSCNWNIQT